VKITPERLRKIIKEELEAVMNKPSPSLSISRNGTKTWILNGEYHREDGPAIERSDGKKVWFLNGELHRKKRMVGQRKTGFTTRSRKLNTEET
jgi:hypothetical protein